MRFDYTQAFPKSAGLLAMLCGLCFTVGCDYTLAGKWEYKELRRVKSPDSRLEAVIVEGGAGATTSTVTKVFLVSTGSTIDAKESSDSSVFAADHMSSFD